MAEPEDVARDLRLLETELRRLEIEYNQFFAGQLPRPPWETRSRVDALVRRYDRAYIQSYADRFRFNTLQSRYATFIDLWDRGLRAREEGRAGPFTRSAAERPDAPAAERVVHVTTFSDPAREIDRMQELYDRVIEARREVGKESVPFHKFVHLVKDQVRRLRKAGSPEVAFRVSIRDGQVTFTARALKGIDKKG